MHGNPFQLNIITSPPIPKGSAILRDPRLRIAEYVRHPDDPPEWEFNVINIKGTDTYEMEAIHRPGRLEILNPEAIVVLKMEE